MKAKAALMSFIFIVILAGSGSSALAGSFFTYPAWWCSSNACEARYDFGRAFTLARDGQIMNPNAGSNLSLVTGLDGQAAEKAMQKYIDSFSKKEEAQAPGGMMSFALSPSPGGYAH